MLKIQHKDVNFTSFKEVNIISLELWIFILRSNMSDSDSEIYENDVELPRYQDAPQQTSLRIKRTKTGK